MKQKRNMTKILWTFLCCVLLTAMLTIPVNAAVSLKLNKSILTVYTGSSYTLKATVNGTSKKVTWKSSNKTIATVNSAGKVTGKKAGTCTITATVNGVKKSCKVTVKKTSIKLNKTSVSVKKGSIIALKATVVGKSTKVTWSTSNKSVATVNAAGKVTGKKAGTCIITAKANGITAKCKVVVKNVSPNEAVKKYIQNREWYTFGGQPWPSKYVFDEKYVYGYSTYPDSVGQPPSKREYTAIKTTYGYYIQIKYTYGVYGYQLRLTGADANKETLTCIGNGDPYSTAGYSGSGSLETY